MNKVYFKYTEHPGDFFRNTDVVILPNPQEDMENFLIQFLKNYQSDERVTYVDDLYKLLDDDFFNEEDKNNFVKIIGKKSELEIKTAIQHMEMELRNEAYKNFYNLVRTKQIQIIDNGKK